MCKWFKPKQDDDEKRDEKPRDVIVKTESNPIAEIARTGKFPRIKKRRNNNDSE